MDFLLTKIYDKRDDFDFDIVKFQFLDGDVPNRASYGVYISHTVEMTTEAEVGAKNKNWNKKTFLLHVCIHVQH